MAALIYIALFICASLVALFSSPTGIVWVSLWTSLAVIIAYIVLALVQRWGFVSASVLSPFIKTKTIARLLLFFVASLWLQNHSVNRIVDAQFHPDWHGKNLVAEGRVIGLPERDGRFLRFQFELSSLRLQSGQALRPRPHTVRLSWRTDQSIQALETWRFVLRLKTPRGFVNPKGFDYQAWMLGKGIFANGYVYKNQAVKLSGRPGLWPKKFGEGLRDKASRSLDRVLADKPQKGLIRALLIGDKSKISNAQWSLFQTTGTIHLMAISGLHIGLIAGFAYALGRVLFAPLLISNKARWYRGCVAAGSVSAALIYANLAGFSVPTQRAFFCVLCVQVLLWLGVRTSFLLILGAIACLLLANNPFLAMQSGFVLSFSAVALLLYLFAHRRQSRGLGRTSKWRRYAAKLQGFFLTQYALWLGLFPLIFAMNLPVAVVSPIANTFAIPAIALFILPLAFIALGFSAVSDTVSGVLFDLAGAGLHYLLLHLERLSAWLPAHADALFAWRHALTGIDLGMLVLSVLLILSPKPLRLRAIGCLWSVVIIIHAQATSLQTKNTFTVLDVGQGLSSVLHGKRGSLVFDIGAKFSESFSIGDQVLLPYLAAQARTPVKLVVLSHADNDHAGAADEFIRTLRTRQASALDVLSGEPKEIPLDNIRWCLPQYLPPDGTLDADIHIDLLWPDPSLNAYLSPKIQLSEWQRLQGNNSSCVLFVEMDGLRLLISGDIEKEVERVLLEQGKLPREVDVLIAPHHGSATSSTREFIEHLSPRHVIFSAGYRNRYRHPSKHVVHRYRKFGAQVWNTAQHGAIRMEVIDGELSIEGERCVTSKRWLKSCSR